MGLGFEFVAKDNATATMRRVRQEMGKTSDQAMELERRQKKAAQGVRRGAAMMAAGVGALAVVNKATKAFGEFEFVIASAAGKMVDGRENLKELNKAALEAGKLTQFDPEEAAMGLAELGAQGLSAKESIKALRPVLDLAASSMGQLGVADAATVAMASLNAFGKTVEDLPDVVNKLAMVSDSSAFQMRDFQTAISQAAAQAKAGGQSFESMLSMLGLLRDAGNEASSAATAYREAMRRVAGDKGALKQMKKLGVSSVASNGQMKDLGDIIAELHPKLQKLGVQERNLALVKIFGVRGMKTYNALISSYEKQMKKGVATTGQYTKGHEILLERLGNAHGYASKKVDTALQTTGGQYKLIAGSWKTVVIQFGSVFAKTMLPVLKTLTDWLNKVVVMIEKLSPAEKKAISYTVVFGAALITVIGALKVMRGLMMMMTLGRLAGQYITGQAAMATSTAATTTAVTAQNTAMAASTSRLSRFGSALGNIMGWARTAAISLGMMYASYKITSWAMIKMLTEESEKAQDAQQKITNFRLAFRQFNRTIRRGADHMSDFNVKLREHTGLLVKTAAVSSKSAENVLMKVTATVGRLSLEKQRALVGMYNAIRKNDIKAATEYRKQAFEAERKITALSEARVHIRAQQYQRDIMHTKDKSKREHMAQTILLSGVIKQQEMEMGFAKQRETMLAGINAIEDPVERNKQLEKANALWAKQQDQVKTGQLKIAKQAQQFGLLPKGFTSTADYFKIFDRIKPMMQTTGVMGGQLQLSLKELAMARKGTAVGATTPGRIKAFGELREAAALAGGRTKHVAAGERTRYEEALKKGTAPTATRKPMEAMRGGYEDINDYLSFYTGGLLGTQKEEIASLKDVFAEAKLQVDINVRQGETTAEVTAKNSGRSGKRFKPTVRSTGTK